MLAFPAGSDNAYLTRTPWEYLHSPESNELGYFLARRSGLVLSRMIPAGLDPDPPKPLQTLRVLPVVADPDPDGFGKVDAKPVLRLLAGLHGSSRFHVLPVVEQATAERLKQAVAAGAPDLVHYIGHGDYRTDTGRGCLALHSEDADELVDWVDEERFADMLCGQREVAPPRAVILHTCLGGSSNFSTRFAGLAPELVRRGVHCVVAMQYAILSSHAETFSTTLYERLVNGDQLDVAVQACRDVLAAAYPKEPRLVGVPMVYLRNAEPLLADPAGATGVVP
jgi:hypothetical protein